MTTEQKEKATSVLLKNDCAFALEHRMPMVWMVGNEVCLFYSAALRWKDMRKRIYGEDLTIEPFTVQEAYEYHYHKPMPPSASMRILKNIDQHGSFYHWESFKDPRITNQTID